MISDLRLARAARDAIVAHARETAPAECCGLLIGDADTILEAVPTRNIAHEPTRFLIDPKDHIDGRRHARGRGLAVVGFYHSHPRSAAEPSATDEIEAAYPGNLYLIVGLAQDSPDVRLFRLGDGNFVSVPFVTVD